jgi:hypothetical protein
MLDLEKPVMIRHGAATLSTSRVPRTIATLARTLDERGDPSMLFAGEVTVDLP